MSATDSARSLGDFAAGLAYADLPEGVRRQITRATMDALGCGLFGSTLPWCRAVLAAATTWGGTGATPIWGTRTQISPDAAALVNGTQVHSFELDDLHKEAIIHPGGVTLPAMFAVLSATDRPFSGQHFLVAAAAGYEVSIRVGMATGLGLLHRGWHNNGVLGTFGGAVGSGVLMGLTATQMADAISMAATQSAGLMAAQYSSMVKRIHAGKAAQSGLYAAAWAREGIAGIDAVFETPYGGFASTFADTYDLNELTRGLGTEWRAANVGYKPYPACGSSHTSIDAALALQKEYGFTADDIAAIDIDSSTATAKHVGWAYAPGTVTTAQMNLPYAVATAFRFGEVTTSHYTTEAMADPQTVKLANMVNVVGDDAIDAKGRSHRHEIRMAVRLHSGETVRRDVTHALGSEHHPLDDAALERKFRGLAAAALPADQVDELVDAIWNLSDADDVRDLAALLVPRSSR